MKKTLRAYAFLLTVVVLFFVVFVAGAVLAQRGLFHAISQFGGVLDLDVAASDDPTPVRFTVQPGDSAATIGERLEGRALIRSALAFRMQARQRGVESLLAAGDYELRPNMRPGEILQLMQRQRAEAGLKVTFPEGWRAEEMADRLEAAGIVSRTEFLRATTAGSFSYPFLAGRPAGSSLEGYLFPDTYTFSRGITATAVVDALLHNFDRRFDISMRQQAERQGLSVAQVVILASIVEHEAVAPEERAMIAEVFLNRLALKMPLQADPTVQYAVAEANLDLARREGYWKRALTAADLQVDSPYNTYKYRGLPPGAIANPGLAALKAVISPTSTGYLYFVAKLGGGHAFASTLEEHNENVAQYREMSRAR